jgi:hypothetical protein
VSLPRAGLHVILSLLFMDLNGLKSSRRDPRRASEMEWIGEGMLHEGGFGTQVGAL